MKLIGLSDIHGNLIRVGPEFTADVAVIAGDMVPTSSVFHGTTSEGVMRQVEWVHSMFIPWLQSLPVRHVVLTWGNHDWFADQQGGSLVPDLWWPENVHVLVNTSVDIEGVRFYGVPQTPRFHDWAFNEDDTPESLGRRWDAVPDGTRVLVSDGPPRGSCDSVGNLRVGSLTMERWLRGEATNRPEVMVCGHIHEGAGQVSHCGSTTVYNVSIVTPGYKR